MINCHDDRLCLLETVMAKEVQLSIALCTQNFSDMLSFQIALVKAI